MSISIFTKNKINSKSEKDLIQLAKKDSRYFAPVYKKYHEQIFRFVYQRMNSLEDADDITSQVFLKVLLNLKKFEFKGFPFSSWVYKIALNEINQFYRNTKNKRTINIEEVNIKEIIGEINISYNYDQQEQLIIVLNKLSEENILLIEMRFFEKRPFKEIAQILGIKENNAKVKTYRVLNQLKKLMS